MDTEDFDPFRGQSNIEPLEAGKESTVNDQAVRAIQERQAVFLKAMDRLWEFWWRIPNLGPRAVDLEVEALHEELMKLGPYLGVSSISIRPLRECCGKKRDWKDEPVQEERLGWGFGDIVRRITRFFGFRHCDSCERKRRWLNSIFRRG